MLNRGKKEISWKLQFKEQACAAKTAFYRTLVS